MPPPSVPALLFFGFDRFATCLPVGMIAVSVVASAAGAPLITPLVGGGFAAYAIFADARRPAEIRIRRPRVDPIPARRIDPVGIRLVPCIHCGHFEPSGTLICANCKRIPDTAVCPACDRVRDSSHEICPKCGTELRRLAHAPRPQRPS